MINVGEIKHNRNNKEDRLSLEYYLLFGTILKVFL